MVLPAWGQQSDTVIVALPAIEIGAMRSSTEQGSVPYATSMLVRSAEVLATQPGLSLQGALKGLPGVWINERGHYALGERVQIRGMGWRSAFGVRGVQVLLDGIPLTLPDGQGMLDIVDPAFIRQADVVRGPASTFWGNGSGGVLVLSTAGFRDSSYVGLRAMRGSYNLNQYAVEAAVPLGRHRFHGYVSHVENEGYRAYSQGSFLRSGLHGLLDLGPRTQLRMMGALAIQDTESPGALTAAQFTADRRGADTRNVGAMAGKESTQVQLGATLFHQTPIGLVSVTGYGLSRQLDNPLSFAYIDLARRVGGTRLQLENRNEGWTWGIGFDAGFQRDDRLNFNNEGGSPGTDLDVDQRETVSNYSVFAQGSRLLAGRWSVSAGLRADRIQFELTDHLPGHEALSGDRVFSAVSPSIGVTRLIEHATLYANVSTAFETPTTTELVNQPDGSAGLNAEVGAQKTGGAEIGMRGTSGHLTYDVALFAMRVSDLLQSFQDSDGRTYYQNAGENTHRGIEVALRHGLGSVGDVHFTYAGSGFVFDDAELKDNRIPGVPVHRAYAGLNSMWHGVSSRIGVEWVSDMYANDSNEAVNPGYTVVDINLSYQTLRIGNAHLRPFFNVSNVLDASYVGSMVINAFGGRYFEPSPGRTVQFGVSAGF